MTTRVLIVDDYPIVRHGLRAYLSTDPGVEVVGEAAGGPQALRLAEQLQPDAIVIDVLMPTLDGVGAVSALRQRCPRARILVLASPDHDQVLLDAMAAGASAFVPKDAELQELRLALHYMSCGQRYISQKLAGRLIERRNRPNIASVLTEREQEVLRLLSQGCSNKDIAASLGISITTVKTHVSSILSKLEVSSRMEAALDVRARELGRPVPTI